MPSQFLGRACWELTKDEHSRVETPAPEWATSPNTKAERKVSAQEPSYLREILWQSDIEVHRHCGLAN